MKKLLILFCMLAPLQNQSVDLNVYVESFNPKKKVSRTKTTKVINHDFVGGIKGTKKL